MTSFPNREALQPERTALAWQRTAITATLVMVPLVVVNARRGSWWMTVLGSVATIAAGALVVRVHARFAELLGDDEHGSPFEAMVRVAVVATLTSVVGGGTALTLFLR